MSPRELTGSAALERGIPPGARGGIQILGEAIIDEELKGGTSSMMQLQRAGSVLEALRVIVHTSSIISADSAKLQALVQNPQKGHSSRVGGDSSGVGGDSSGVGGDSSGVGGDSSGV